MNKANVLALGVLLIALSLYLQVLYNNPGGILKETVENYNINENTFISVTTLVFSAGLIIVIGSILIKPRRRIIAAGEASFSAGAAGEAAPSEAVEEGYQKEAAYSGAGVEAAYSGEEAETVEKDEAGFEQAYEEEAPAVESYEPPEEVLEQEEKPERISEVVGFCPRCGAPVSEGMRYCRKCGLKLK
ncbi:MAG: zinc-ribbon domain-containing protein [Thermoproteota archaeon]